ncbi:MAG TPA: BON domain-containing protein [Vicinamibacteria bacterium]
MTSFNGSGRRPGRTLVALAAVSVILGATAARADDADVKRKVEERLAKAKVYSAADVRVSVDQGTVTLDGVASRMDAAYDAERAARKESKSVVNNLRVVTDVECKDSEIRKDVADRILSYSWYTVYDSIGADVENGFVLLRGSVNQPYRKTDIEQRIASIPGVKGMKSEIQVQGVSGFDDSLRRQLVRRIYGDERFVQYASWAHPPIRIVVDGGRVTLTGYVSSPVEQQLLGNIARGTLAFAVDNQVKLESERTAEPKKAPGTTTTS